MIEEQEILPEQVKQLLAAHNTGRLRSLLSGQRTSYIAEIAEILDPEDYRIVFNCLKRWRKGQI
jgi:Mg/Co/Ni transporter MgtE